MGKKGRNKGKNRHWNSFKYSLNIYPHEPLVVLLIDLMLGRLHFELAVEHVSEQYSWQSEQESLRMGTFCLQFTF
jgi:hypothetical protein